MDYKYIEQLLDRYFEAETTLKEEQILKAFFEQSEEELPESLRQYKPLFAAMEQDETLGDDFDARLLEMTEEKMLVKARIISLSDRIRPLMRAAAVVAILLTLSTALNQSFKEDKVWADESDYALRYSPSFRGKDKPTKASLIKDAQSGKISTEVGWKGNFNDMALKTVIRRLLSKYGYLSVEMQGAIEHDFEDSEVSRNTIIAENANAEEIKTDDAVYENVDTETGEIKTDVPESAQATDQAAEKNNVDPY